MELLDYWSFGHALTGLALGWVRLRAAPALALATGWELLEPDLGPWGADPSFANSCADVVVLATAWGVARVSRGPRHG